MTSPAAEPPEEAPDGPWLPCPYCGGRLPLGHLARSDEEVGALAGVCADCHRRVTVTVPD